MIAKGEWHNINQLYGAPPGGSGGKAKSLHTSAGRGRYGLINDMVVYDHWYTTLSAQDSFYIKGAGGRVEDYITVESYGEDWFKTPRHEMEYTLSMDEIPENIDDYEKTHYITITQVATGITITVVCTQGPAEWSVDYTLAMYPTTLPASGGYTYGTVYRWVYRNNKLYDYLTLNPTSMNGFTVNGSDHSIGSNWLYIGSAGTEWYTYTRTVYAITSYSFVYAGETMTLDTYVSISQSPNYRITTERYSVSMDAPSESVIQHIGGTFTVKAYCKTANAYIYDSGATEVYSAWSPSSALVFYDGVVTSITPTEFYGEGTILVTVPNHSGDTDREVVVRVRSVYGTNEYAEVVVVQKAYVPIDYISWVSGSGSFTTGQPFTFSAKLAYLKSIQDGTVSVTLKKNSTQLKTTSFTLDGSEYNSTSNAIDVSMDYKTDLSSGDTFYLTATYGEDTTEIELTENK